MKRKKVLFTLFILASFLVVSSYNTTNLQAIEPLANLVFKTAGGGSWGDYGLYTAQYLRDIGIELEIKVEEFSVLVGELVLTHDYDIAFVGLAGGGASPDMRDVFGEDGSLNAFGLTRDMPYGNLSENMQNEGVTISDLDERQQHYYDWQQLLMDKLLPCLPFYAPRSYIAVWANTLGYDYRWGFIDCVPYMSYDGYHDGQVSLDEFNYASANWRELNPLFSDDTSSSFIFNLGDEQILAWSPENAPLKTGLVHEWEQIDDFHYKFYLRDNIFWNPSYNVTGRDASSDPLDTTPIGELMVGLKNGEYSDGSNQQVTAKDAVFTYLAWANPVVSESPTYHDWISDIYVDPVDPLAYHIHIDGNPSTPETEPYVDFWARLPWRILPEFFLNSSDPTVSYTSGGAECTGLYTDMISTTPWVTYSTSAFGCGKFMLDYYIRNSITVLRRSPYWFGVGALDGTAGLTPFVETVNIRVIPDVSAELAEFKAGKLDWTGLTSFPAERKQMQADPRYDVQTSINPSYTFMIYNMRRPFLGGTANYEFLDTPGKEEYTKGVAVRKAIAYAIDREEINDVIHDGEYLLAHCPLYPYTAFYYYNDIIKYDRDLEAALEWLNAAGYDPGIEVTPVPIFGVIAAIGSASFVALLYSRRRKS